MDVVYALRRLRAAPIFTLFSIVTLALGTGATTAIYSIVKTALAPPPGVWDVASIVNISHYPGGGMPMRTLSREDLRDLRSRQTTMTDVIGWRHLRLAVAADGRSRTAFGEIVTANYFATLGVQPAAGRLLQPGDDEPSAARVAVISDRTWQLLFDGRRDAIGRDVKINGETFQIVGVTPPAFKGVFNNGLVASIAWVPVGAAELFPESGVNRLDRDARVLMVKARLKPGKPLSEAAAEVAGIGGQLDREHPIGEDSDRQRRPPYHYSRLWGVQPLADVHINDGALSDMAVGLAAAILIAATLVLLVACTNLANLTLARSASRKQEFGVRLALGASRWRLVREGLIETAVVAAVGSFLGLGIAQMLIVSVGQELSFGAGSLLIEPRLDLAALAVVIGAGSTALVVAGLMPAWQGSNADVRQAIASGASTAALPRWRGRRYLITAQVAVSMLLVALAGQFVSQVRATDAIDGGFDLDRIAVAEIDFASQRVDDARTRSTIERILARLSATPGVETAAASTGLPVGLTTVGAFLKHEGETTVLGYPQFVVSTPSIFRTLGVSVIKGRPFDERDVTSAEGVVVVNETVARLLFDRTDVVGQSVVVSPRDWVGGPPQVARRRTIIGVAEDSDSGSVGRRDPQTGVIYVPFDRAVDRPITFSVRTPGDPGEILGALQSAIAESAPDLAVAQIGTGRRIAGPSILFGQITASLSGTLGVFALILALAGLYGVLSHVVANRRREIGVRMALGGTPAIVRRMVIREGLSPVVLGVIAGATLAVIARYSLRPMFVQLLPTVDPFALGLVPILLIAAGVLACYLPARRASAVDPNVALRQE